MLSNFPVCLWTSATEIFFFHLFRTERKEKKPLIPSMKIELLWVDLSLFVCVDGINNLNALRIEWKILLAINCVTTLNRLCGKTWIPKIPLQVSERENILLWKMASSFVQYLSLYYRLYVYYVNFKRIIWIGVLTNEITYYSPRNPVHKLLLRIYLIEAKFHYNKITLKNNIFQGSCLAWV